MGIYFENLTIWTVLVPLIVFPSIILQNLSTKYIIINKRVEARYGVLSEDFKSSTYRHITSVRNKQRLLGEIIKIGNIVMYTSDSGFHVDSVWNYVKSPGKIKKISEKHIN